MHKVITVLNSNHNVCVCVWQRLIEEQQTQLGDYERAAGQCVCELQKAQAQVHSLQANIRESEANNKVCPYTTPSHQHTQQKINILYNHPS